MSRLFALPLLGLALLAIPATAQTTPAHKVTSKPAAKPAPRTPYHPATVQRAAADPLRGTNDNGKGNSQYAAPGEPITPMKDNGKNTPPYDGPAARKNTTIATPR